MTLQMGLLQHNIVNYLTKCVLITYHILLAAVLFPLTIVVTEITASIEVHIGVRETTDWASSLDYLHLIYLHKY